MKETLGTVYLIHFHRPYKHARHYLGHALDLEARLERHRAGDGARLLQVITAAGIGWTLVRTWPGGREMERQLKRQKNSPRLCPLCHLQQGEATPISCSADAPHMRRPAQG